MTTITRQKIVLQIAAATRQPPVLVKQLVQSFLEAIVAELGKGNRLEFREFGVFEVRQRQAHKALNPKTLTRVWVEPSLTVKFKAGRVMKRTVGLLAEAMECEQMQVR
jgi:integration host factor subunit beta